MKELDECSEEEEELQYNKYMEYEEQQNIEEDYDEDYCDEYEDESNNMDKKMGQYVRCR
jgi:hypothetical protein